MFFTPSKALSQISSLMREWRVQQRLTQEDLAQKSGVPLSTLRKFERTGLISLEAFLKLATVMGLLEKVVRSIENDAKYSSIDDVLKDSKPRSGIRVRQRVRS